MALTVELARMPDLAQASPRQHRPLMADPKEPQGSISDSQAWAAGGTSWRAGADGTKKHW